MIPGVNSYQTTASGNITCKNIVLLTIQVKSLQFHCVMIPVIPKRVIKYLQLVITCIILKFSST